MKLFCIFLFTLMLSFSKLISSISNFMGPFCWECKLLFYGFLLSACTTSLMRFTLLHLYSRNSKCKKIKSVRDIDRFPIRFNIRGKWRTLHNEEHHSVNSSPNIIKIFKSGRMRLVGLEKVIQIIFGHPQRNVLLGRHRHKWEFNVGGNIILDI
jgi:hypothetical protein